MNENVQKNLLMIEVHNNFFHWNVNLIAIFESST